MAHNARIRAPGFWVALGVIDAAEMELFDAARYLSIHEGGGAWAITDNVVIGAAGAQTWRYTLPLQLDNFYGMVLTGKTVTFNPGSFLTVDGTYTLHGAGSVTGVLTVGSGGQIIVANGRQITIQPGGKISVQGSIELTSTSQIQVGTDAQIDVLGQVTVESGAAISFADGGWLKGTVRMFPATVFWMGAGTTTHIQNTFKIESALASIEDNAVLTAKDGSEIHLAQGSITEVAGLLSMVEHGEINWRVADAAEDQDIVLAEADLLKFPANTGVSNWVCHLQTPSTGAHGRIWLYRRMDGSAGGSIRLQVGGALVAQLDPVVNKACLMCLQFDGTWFVAFAWEYDLAQSASPLGTYKVV